MQSDVDEALRLMRMSKISLSDEAGGGGATDVISAIYSSIRDDAGRQKQATYSWPQLTALFTGKDYTVCPTPCLLSTPKWLDRRLDHKRRTWCGVVRVGVSFPASLKPWLARIFQRQEQSRVREGLPQRTGVIQPLDADRARSPQQSLLPASTACTTGLQAGPRDRFEMK